MSTTATNMQTEIASAPKTTSNKEAKSVRLPILRPSANGADRDPVPAARLCERCNKSVLSYNNVSNLCANCQRQHGRPRSKANAQNGAQLKAQPHKAAKSAEPNGADHNHPDHAGVESRVDLRLAAIPRQEKAKLLNAWLSGAF